jgi:hypothetical protein
MRTERRGRCGARGAPVRLLASLGVLAAVLIPVLVGTSAGAASADTSTTCPNSGYSSATIADCSTTTTTQGGGRSHLNLTANYSDQVLSWQACVRPAGAQGSTVNLFVDGQEQNGPGGSGTVLADGCTADSHLSICLAQGTHSVTAVDQAVGSDTKSVNVPASRACESAGSSPSKGGGGALAFTGSEIFRLLVLGAILMILGYAVVRFNRQRRQRS